MNGSWRSPKYEEMWPSFTGRPSGRICSSSFFDSSAFSSAASCASREEIFCSRPFSSEFRSGACMAAPMSDSGPPTAGLLSKSNSRLSMFAICVRRLPSASRRITWAFIWPMRMATASTRRCSSAFNSLISACCSARVCGPGGDAARAVLALADLESEAESGGEDGDEHGRKAGDGEGMAEVEVPGTTFAAREEDDVHRASSGGRETGSLTILLFMLQRLAHRWHPRRPLPREP